MKKPSRKIIIGVMGGGEICQKPGYERDLEMASELGSLIAKEGWVLLTGGRKVGIMNAASKGAKEAGGLTVGILPGRNFSQTSDYVDIQILTGMEEARNNINVLSSDVVVVCKGEAGTISELALALKMKKIILLNFEIGELFKEYLGKNLFKAKTPQEAIELIKNLYLHNLK